MGEPSAPGALAAPGPGDPTRVDRYLIVGRLGSGGFGTVFRAYDPDLARFVALKLVHAGPSSPREAGDARGTPSGELFDVTTAASRREGADDLRARALREAQTLARLDHPNVVPIYDAGLVGSDVFIAMALVEGETLARWLQTRKPGRRGHAQILRAFIEAGRGLEAAHRIGIVHRDFKPENVVVSTGGAVRVLDFGLARVADAGGGVEELPGLRGADELMTYMTRSGLRAGTPAYMAPEQHLGLPNDPRTDQFSFCVAVYRALTGKAPFPGASVAELERAVTEGRVAPIARDARVAPHVEAALRRGLSVAPEDRFPGMSELLKELERDPARTRRRVIGFAGAAAVLAALSAFAEKRMSARPPPCTAGSVLVTDAWNGSTAERTRAAFAATGRAYADEIFDHVRGRLDEYVRDWSSAHVALCESERSGAIASTVAGDEEQCLADRARELRDLADIFVAAKDRAVVDKAIGASDRLSQVSDCQSPSRSVSSVPRPADPALRARVDGIVARLTDAHMRAVTGASVVPEVRALVEEARATSYPPLVGMATFRLAGEEVPMAQYPEAEAALRDAMQEFGRARAMGPWLYSLAALVNVLGIARRMNELAAYEPLLENTVDLAGDDRSLKGMALHALAQCETVRGHAARAADFATRGAALLEGGGPSDRYVAFFLRNLAARAMADAGRYEDAVASLTEALPKLESEFGPHNRQVAYALKSRALANVLIWKLDAARADAQRAEAIDRELNGPDFVEISDGLEVEGIADVYDARPGAAIEPLEQAIALRTKAFGPDAPLVADDLCDEAAAKLDLGRFVEAEELAKRAVAIFRKSFGKDHPDLDSGLDQVGAVEMRLGHLDAAEAALSESLAERRARVGSEPHLLTETLMTLAQVALRQGRVDEARKLASEAEDRLAGTQPSPGTKIAARVILADAEAAGGDTGAALAHLEEARAAAASLVRVGHPLLAHATLHLAEVTLAAGDAGKAAPLFDSAAESLASWNGDPEDRLRARFGRAKAWWALGGEHRAQALAEGRAILPLASAPEAMLPNLRDAIAAWLKSAR